MLIIAFSMAGLVIGNRSVFACPFGLSRCGPPPVYTPNPPYPVCAQPGGWMGYNPNPAGNSYFSGNKIPNPYPNGPPGSYPCNVLDDGGPALMFVNNSAQFISTIKGYLNQSGYYGYSNSVGAAFIIDFMLGRTPDGSIANGVNYAKNPANLAAWENMVTMYGSGVAGVTPYWVNWSQGYLNSCGSGHTTNSSYSPDTGDDVIRNDTCGNIALPQIVFYWNNGKSWFAVGKPCGNIQDDSQTPPPPISDAQPSGTISLTCNATQQQVAAITFGDDDSTAADPVQAYITTTNNSASPPQSWTSSTQSSPSKTGSATIPIPPPPTTDPYISQPVYLWVKDVGAGGSGTFSSITSANTRPCAKLSCNGNQITPEGMGTGNPLDPYEKFDAVVSVQAVPSAPPGATMTLAIVNSKGKTIYTATQPTTIDSSGVISSATFPGIAATGAAGEYEIDWHLNAPAGVSSPFCNDSLDVAYAPYLKVYGGDVSVGASPYGETTSCIGPDPVRDIPNINAGIYSWNRYTADYSGAGTEVAARTLGIIAGFATAQSASSPAPTGLSFANNGLNGSTQLNPGSGLFGGFLYPAVSSDLGPITADCGLTSDITQAPLKTNQTLSSLVVNPLNFTGQQVVYVNDADVYIDTNIQYKTAGGWASTTDIPSFKLVVIGGNIYIGSNVTRLDGLYISEPQEPGTDYNGGIIFDCAKKVGASFQRLDFQVDNTYYQDCNNQLTVDGAFVGREVKLARTYGSIGQTIATPDSLLGTTNAAEVFNYTPELWLPRGNAAPNQGYTSITGLPPVL